MDSTTVTTVVHETLSQDFKQALLPMEWMMMFLGLATYWLHVVNNCRIAAKGQPYFKAFWNDNFTEIPTTVISCLVLALNANTIPSSLATLHGTMTMFIVGAGGGTLLNGLISAIKPSISRQFSNGNP